MIMIPVLKLKYYRPILEKKLLINVPCICFNKSSRQTLDCNIYKLLNQLLKALTSTSYAHKSINKTDYSSPIGIVET